MKGIGTYIIEKLHIDKDIKVSSSDILKKLEYALKRIFGDDITMCTDYQGDKDKEENWYYELNPESMKIGGTGNSYNANRFIQYCKKVPELEVKELPGGVRIGNQTYWVKSHFSVRYIIRRELQNSFYISIRIADF